jgi:hypothetical protein
MTTYTNIFTGALIAPALAAYNNITLPVGSLALQWPLEVAPNSNLACPLIDINVASPSSAGLILPPANSVGVGTFIIINNLSAFPVTVYNNAGAVIVASQAAGSVFFYYIQNNTTAAGIWFAFQYGAAIAVPSVAAIAGAGLVAIGAQLAQNITVFTTATTPFTLGSGNRDQLINYTGGAGIMNLPGSVAVGAGFYVQIRNSGSSILQVTPAGSDTINGSYTNASPLSMNPGDSAFIVTDGTGLWYTIGLGPQVTAAFNVLAISLAGDSGNYTLSGTQLNQIGYTVSGALAGNVIIIVPPTKQEYWVRNLTTGGFTVQIATAAQGAGGPVVPNGASAIFYSDGSNVYLATPASAISSVPVPINQGGTGAITAGAALTNLGGTSIGIALFQIASAQAAQIQILAPSFADAMVMSMVM